jgi:hypothetical protein
MMNRPARLRLLVALTTCAVVIQSATAFSQVTLVRDGKVRAVVVTAVKPSAVAAYAVEELVNHVKRTTAMFLWA